MFASIANTPEPPYWAVIFTAVREDADDGYAEMSRRMEELAAEQPGYLGVESVRGADGTGITVSYWATEESLHAWKANAEHRVAQRKGHEGFYKAWFTRVCMVERAYAFELGSP